MFQCMLHTCLYFLYCFVFCRTGSMSSKENRHTLRNDAYTPNFQPVNSDLKSFRGKKDRSCFSDLNLSQGCFGTDIISKCT